MAAARGPYDTRPTPSRISPDLYKVGRALSVLLGAPAAILLFPNRSAMARILSLWRSIEKKGSESEANRQMSGYK